MDRMGYCVEFRASPACGALLARLPFAKRRGGLLGSPSSRGEGEG